MIFLPYILHFTSLVINTLYDYTVYIKRTKKKKNDRERKCVLDFLFFSMIETIEPHVHIRKRVLLIYLLLVEVILPKKRGKESRQIFLYDKKKTHV